MSRRNPARSLPMTAGGRPSEPGSAQCGTGPMQRSQCRPGNPAASGREEAPALALRSPGWAFPRALIPDRGHRPQVR